MRVTFGEMRGTTTLEYRTINFGPGHDHGSLWGWIRLAGRASALRKEVDEQLNSIERLLEGAKRGLDAVAHKKGWNVETYGPDTVGVYGEQGGLRFQAGLTVSMGALDDEEKTALHEAVKDIMRRAGFDRRPTFG